MRWCLKVEAGALPNGKRIQVTLVRSTIGALKKHKACVIGLGLRKPGSSTTLEDTPAIRGMIAKVSHLLRVDDKRIETRSRKGPSRRTAGHPRFIWERDGWPKFTWDEERLNVHMLAMSQGRNGLRTRVDALGFGEDEKEKLANEISGLLPTDDSGVAEMMNDATNNYRTPLTKQRLCAWHRKLFPDGIADNRPIITGDWRDDAVGAMVVASGAVGKERVHFEGPPADRVNTQMHSFMDWFESPPENPMLVAAIAHLWFLTIHPFDNGNGRIARAIADMALARVEGSSQRFYSVAAQIHRERKTYDFAIEQTQRGELDITGWLAWFVNCEQHAIDESGRELDAAITRRRFWRRFPESTLNYRQVKVMKKFLDRFEGKLGAKKWAKLAKCAEGTATTDINDLIERGALRKDPDNVRNTSYLVGLELIASRS